MTLWGKGVKRERHLHVYLFMCCRDATTCHLLLAPRNEEEVEVGERWAEDLCPLGSQNSRWHPSGTCLHSHLYALCKDVNFQALVARFTVFMPSWIFSALFHHRESTRSRWGCECATASKTDITRETSRSLCPFVCSHPWADSLVHNTRGPGLTPCCHRCSQPK